ncbi:lactate utilization protein C [Streptomyces sp. NPDC102274]|uniref:LutC/YkgG family protein n=1 Tax=Streptomyces sp. NPDC102274 TaxID=3366151 RepID=UPI00380DD2CC
MSTGAGAASGIGTGAASAAGTGAASDTGTGGGGSRERILARIRAAVAAAPDAPEAARDYLETHTPGERVIDLLAENLADYRALVHRTDNEGLPALIARLLAERGSRTVLVPPLLPAFWLSALSSVGTDLIRVEDDPTATARELDVVDSVITGCALAIAETGTLVLDAAPDQGRRRITLVPDHHICVVRTADQVVGSVPQAMPRLDPTRPLTWISGPSATSDIELDRVEGVHGPRTLEVILLSE